MTPNKPKPYGRAEIELTQTSFAVLAHVFFFAGLFVMWVAMRPEQ